MGNKSQEASARAKAGGGWVLLWRDFGAGAGCGKEWQAQGFESKSEAAAHLWAQWGDPLADWGESSCARGAMVVWFREGRWARGRDKHQEIVLIEPTGALGSVASLRDRGAAEARESGRASKWDEWWWNGSRRAKFWNGSGPVPSTGRSARRGWRWRIQRRFTLGAGSRRELASSEALARMDLEDGQVEAGSDAIGKFVNKSRRKAAKALGEIGVWWDDEPHRARGSKGWKSDARKRRKSWDRK